MHSLTLTAMERVRSLPAPTTIVTHNTPNDIPPITSMPHDALSGSTESTTAPIRKPPLRSKKSFQITIQSNGNTIIGTETHIQDAPTYPTHFPNNMHEDIHDPTIEQCSSYDFNIPAISLSSSTVLINGPPTTYFGGKGRIAFGDVVIFNGNTRIPWNVIGVKLAHTGNITYMVHDHDNDIDMLVHCPRNWSLEAGQNMDFYAMTLEKYWV